MRHIWAPPPIPGLNPGTAPSCVASSVAFHCTPTELLLAPVAQRCHPLPLLPPAAARATALPTESLRCQRSSSSVVSRRRRTVRRASERWSGSWSGPAWSWTSRCGARSLSHSALRPALATCWSPPPPANHLTSARLRCPGCAAHGRLRLDGCKRRATAPGRRGKRCGMLICGTCAQMARTEAEAWRVQPTAWQGAMPLSNGRCEREQLPCGEEPAQSTPQGGQP